MKLRLYSGLLWFFLSASCFVAKEIKAQCINWSVSALVISGSTCAGNGSFSVSLSGADVGNLTNVQYGIAMGTNGFSVPLNNSNVFSNIPPGTYQVSVVGLCNGNYVGKNTSVTIPGSYTPPLLAATVGRHALSCGNYGIINLSVNNNRPPYTLSILTKPAAYTGPTSFTMTASTFSIPNLPAGGYTLQVSDACGGSSFSTTAIISAYSPGNITLTALDINNAGCDSLSIPTPGVINSNSVWIPYKWDTLYKVSVQISNNAFPATGYIPLNASGWKVKLSSGFTLKDCYGQTLTYTIQPPCGSTFQLSKAIPYPYLSNSIQQKCNTSFISYLDFNGMLCYPVAYTIKDANNNAYGTYTTASSSATSPSLPLGAYTIQYTTADGYIGTGSTGASLITGNLYQVTVESGSHGVHNYIEGFTFSTTASLGVKTVELFSGPPGYTYYYPYWSGQYLYVTYNHTPTLPGTRMFPMGSYVWKITDSCGVYYLPITVTNQDLYQYTVGISKQYQSCDGLWVFPTGSATHNGLSKPIQFLFLKNNQQYNPSPSTIPVPYFNPGDSVLIKDSGHYTILPFSIADPFLYRNGYQVQYPSPYTQSISFDYNFLPAQVDVYKTSGYACQAGAVATIHTQGKNGLPFVAFPYKYYLAQLGNGATGPYTDSNSTGTFTNFGGIVNTEYEVKVVDSCGSFAVQKVKILDLQTARLVTNSKYVACEGDSVVLYTPYFPTATYTWTGPNGFSSSTPHPVIPNITAQDAGLYYLSLSLPGCTSVITDSTRIVVNSAPLVPAIAVHCGPPALLTLTNAQNQYEYTWEYYDMQYGNGFRFYDFGDSIHGYFIALYRAFAVDTFTGCQSLYSDTVNFTQTPNDTFVASIYSPHLQLCAGDTTTLVANGNALSYQWFRNGNLIPGATAQIYMTSVPGSYKVYVDGGECASDTSGEVTVTVVSLPSVNITAPIQTICSGDTALITATYDSSYQYTWVHNGFSVPGVQTDTLKAYQTGDYYAVVSNGGCIAISDTVRITVLPLPVVNLMPSAPQFICSGTTVNFSTPYDASYIYTWFFNGNVIPNASTNQYTTNVAGAYSVAVANGICADTSQAVAVSILPQFVQTANDTIFCVENPIYYKIGVGNGYDSIRWSTGAVTDSIIITQGGMYWVEAMNDCGVYRDTIVVYSLNDLYPGLPDDTMICNNQFEAVVTLPNVLTNILWSTGATTPSIIISQPGMYYVQAESSCGILYDTMNVSFCAPVIDNVTLTDDTICEGECLIFQASLHNYPQHWVWNFEGGNPDSYMGENPPTVCYAHEGRYSMQLIVSNAGGADTFSKEIVVLPQPIGQFEDTVIVVPYKTILTLPACSDAAEIYWYQDDSLICSDCPIWSLEAKLWRTTYQCVLKNRDCTDTCIYRVDVTGIPTDVWMPTAFSPNGDGKNDWFSIISDNPNIYIVELSVYNRWGQQVYRSNTRKGWDGTFKGVPAELGVYYWLLQYKITGNDHLLQQKGDVTVIR